MNTQMVSVTNLQRNSKKVLAEAAKNPLIVLRNSVPEAVIISIEEYKRLANLEKETLKKEILANMEYLHERNKHFSDKEINEDIEYARKHASSSRWYEYFGSG